MESFCPTAQSEQVKNGSMTLDLMLPSRAFKVAITMRWTAR